MKAFRNAGISAMVVFCAGTAIGQDVAHDADKSVTKTGHVVKQVGQEVGRTTKYGLKDAGRGTKGVAKGSVKGVEKGSKKTGNGIKEVAGKWAPST